MLPRTFTWTSVAPAATRVDPQVAFGQGKGFQAMGGGSAKPWLPTGSPTGAVIWKGYIHLAKAGTYYFGTISHGPSAVYVNQARVALNGTFGGVLVADAFSYAQEEVRDYVQNRSGGNANVLTGLNARDQYVVPVSIDAPRDLPIEVQYNWAAASGHEYEGIDLFWVTPDSPRDANSKPIAKIVPSDALYSEAPTQQEKPIVRSANSTISADHLYFPTEYAGESVTVTIRLADKDGNPVAGKRVYISSLTSYGNSDAITQPEKPTDKNGETTAKIRANASYAVGHDSAIYATDVTDFVDVAQVAHVTFQQVDWNFFTDAFSPYYDRRFSVTPRPPVVGQPATLKTELKNHSKFPATVTVIFRTTDWNIGFTSFEEIARVKDITLQPGESKEVSTTFTPKEVMSHKCYRVEVRGHYVAMNQPGGTGGAVFAAALLPPMMLQNNTPANSSGVCIGLKTEESCWGIQINTSTVEPSEPWWQPYSFCDCRGEFDDGYNDGHAGRAPRRDFSEYHDDPHFCAREANYGSGYEMGKKAREIPPPPPPPPPPRVPKSSWSFYNAGWLDGCTTDRPEPKRMGDNYHDYYTGFHSGRRDCPSHPNADADWLMRFSVKMQGFSEWMGGCEKRSSSPSGTRASLTRDDGMLIAASGTADAPRLPTHNNQPPSVCFERMKIGERPYYRTTAYQTRATPASFVLSHIEAATNPGQSQGEPPVESDKRRSALPALFELASDFHLGDETSRSNLVAMIEERTLASYEESLLIHGAVVTQPDGNYRRLTPAAADVAYAYLRALHSSYNRFQGALVAADKDWGPKQFKATQQYAALAVAALTAEAERDDLDLAELQKTPFAVRRSPERQAAFAQQLKASGLTPELVGLMRDSGGTDAQIAAIRKEIAQASPGDIGVSPAEMLAETAKSRRSLAAELARLAQATPGELAARSIQTFELGNPHDKEETIDLFIRPISIPVDWKLSILDAGEQAQFKAREVEAGNHYVVTLPAKAKVKVASEVVPVGEVGTNTSTRWAVEGKIGNELIGGMVHEMNVPYIVADLKLPPVGSQEVEEELPASSKPWARITAEIAAGIVLLGVLAYLVVFWRKRQRVGPSPSA